MWRSSKCSANNGAGNDDRAEHGQDNVADSVRYGDAEHRRLMPTATANSRRISGTVEMVHLTVSMVAFARARFDRYRFDSRELVESLIQINPRRAWGVAYGRPDPRQLAA